VKHPNVRVLADLYHMTQKGEGPQSILKAGRKYLRHVHVAENARRTPPGVDGDDFTPYFRALKEIGYRGNISIECGWSDFRKQVGPAIQELQRQLKAVGM
jgi:sugar phosphate isomerase/epimerase